MKSNDYSHVLEEIPTFRPTTEEFNDPIQYLSTPNVLRNGIRYGMIKLIPPDSFVKPDIKKSIDINKFKFKIRLQKLSELHILNRCRLFLSHQLTNFEKMNSHGACTTAVKPSVSIDDQEVYLYDLFIEIIKYYGSDSPNNTTNTKTDGNYIKVGSGANKNKRMKLENHGDSIVVNIPNPKKFNHSSDSSAMWNHMVKKFNLDRVPDGKVQLKSVFNSKLLKYFQFLYDKKDCDFMKNIHEHSNGYSVLQDQPKKDEIPDNIKCSICEGHISIGKLSSSFRECSVCNSIYHLNCVDRTNRIQQNRKKNVSNGNDRSNNKDWVCLNCLIGNGHYGFKEETKSYKLNEFKAQLCSNETVKNISIKDLEKAFWNNVCDINSDLIVYYGADIHNEISGTISGFESATQHPMNLLNLPNAKGSLLPLLGRKISGMTVPWIYIGSRYSTFCWHLEDQYTLSANYQFEGASKVWYSIPPGSSDSFDKFMLNLSPDLFLKQPDLLHQLVTLVSPYDPKFINSKIKCFKAIQNPGEYIITFPKCYHAGFNCGYNFNEAVNFTLNSWLPYGIEALIKYKLSNKSCVFDMWELMLKILDEMFVSKSATEKGKVNIEADEFLARTCHSNLLNFVNGQEKIYYDITQLLKDEGFYMLDSGQISMDQENGSHDEDEFDVLCDRCNTICSIAFVVRGSKKLIKTTSQLIERQKSFKHLRVYCLDDYIKIIRDTEEFANIHGNCGGNDYSTDSNDYGYNIDPTDTLYYLKEFKDIRQLLKLSEHHIDRM
ncbi:histone demethylase SCDLUD_000054 [Saccharomycodes ludwigii]|uniref:histone demethylase n=1 Tax=Saccharomycodes ludwigii TaxID=36035 RepID=UPI001E86FBB7|nr:hypothetical protein SCDLUD_000054 [Saccharomycodes ludwigii]KAH3902477.1 hypothetical protein SCDLUD_000054 [Saccharomycodes ludwigii]